MDTELEAFAARFRTWLSEHPDLRRWRGERPATVEKRLAASAELLVALHDAGWSRYGWPEEFGGLGGHARERGILYDELGAAGVPVPDQLYVLETVGPAVTRFAPKLAAAYLTRYLRGEEFWCQGFSEPDAGSDLAALRCRARVLDDGSFRVSGQKIWSSYGYLADRMVTLVRTGPADSRHRGLTMLLIDLDSPGITRRPIRLANGQDELSEVFFDEVTVARNRLIGEVDQGWSVAMYLLQFERGMYAWMRQAHLRREIDRIATTLPTDHPATHAEIGRACVAHRALRARTWHTLSRLAAGESPGPEISADKVLLATAEQAVLDAGRRLDLPGFAFGDASLDEERRAEWFYTRAASIYGGSAEVQRSIIADHILRLPREARA